MCFAVQYCVEIQIFQTDDLEKSILNDKVIWVGIPSPSGPIAQPWMSNPGTCHKHTFSISLKEF